MTRPVISAETRRGALFLEGIKTTDAIIHIHIYIYMYML